MRFQPRMDEYGRWAVLDTGQPFFHLMTSRYVDEDSAQAMADILNASKAASRSLIPSGCSSAEKDRFIVASLGQSQDDFDLTN